MQSISSHCLKNEIATDQLNIVTTDWLSLALGLSAHTENIDIDGGAINSAGCVGECKRRRQQGIQAYTRPFK